MVWSRDGLAVASTNIHTTSTAVSVDGRLEHSTEQRGSMPLNRGQRQILEEWMRSKAIVQCPACGDSSWQFSEASYVKALLEAGETDLTEDEGVVKLSCRNCGYVMLFDAERLGIRGLWDQKRNV